MKEAGGAQRNRGDYRLQVLCEARILLCLLPPDSRRDAVLEALAGIIREEWEIKQKFYATKIIRKSDSSGKTRP